MHIGNTEPIDCMDLEHLALHIGALQREKDQLEDRNDQLQHQNLDLRLENNELRRNTRELDDRLENERRRYERELKDLKNQLDENTNFTYDMKHKHRLQLERKDEQIRSLSNEVNNIKSRLGNYENGDLMDIRPRRSKRFKSSVLKECKRCHSAISENNTECCFHPEKPVRAPIYTSTNQLRLWKCCYQVSKLEPPGCTYFDYHEPAT